MSVTPYKISGCEYQQDVFFAVHGVGFSERKEDTSGNDVDIWRPGEIELEAQQSDVDASLFYHEEHNAGFNTRGDTGAGDDMSDWGHVIYNAAGCLPVIGDFQDYAELGASVYNAASNNEVEEFENMASGPYASVGSVWDVFPEEEELIVEDEGYYFGFATEMHWQLKNDDVDLSQTHTLEISSTLITEHFEAPDQAPPTTSTTEGPEASVEISIKNREIEEIESDNKDSYGDSVSVTNRDGSLYWDDEISVLLNDQGWGYYLGFAYYPKVPEIDLSVNWDDGTEETVKENWEPYEWDVNIGVGYSVRRDKETSISHVYDLEDDLGMEYGDDETVTIEITAEVLDQYGGWEETISYDLTIRYREPYSSSPPGGGGGGAIPTGGDFSTFTRDSSRPVQYISTDEATGLLEEKDIWLLSHNEAIYLVDETEDETEFYLVD